MAVDLKSARAFKDGMDDEFSSLYEGRDRAVRAFRELVVANGGEIRFGSPIWVTDVEGRPHDVDSAKIGPGGTVCLIEGDKAYSLFSLDFLALMNFFNTVAIVLLGDAE